MKSPLVGGFRVIKQFVWMRELFKSSVMALFRLMSVVQSEHVPLAAVTKTVSPDDADAIALVIFA